MSHLSSISTVQQTVFDRLKPMGLIGRRSPSYMRKEAEEEEEQYHSLSHPWVLERHPSMVYRYVM